MRSPLRQGVAGSDGLEHEVPGVLVAEEVFGRERWLRQSRVGCWCGHCPKRETVREGAAGPCSSQCLHLEGETCQCKVGCRGVWQLQCWMGLGVIVVDVGGRCCSHQSQPATRRGHHRRAARPGPSASRNTWPATCTTTSVWSTTACCGRGRCPKDPRSTRPRNAWPCTSKIIRSNTGSSRA